MATEIVKIPKNISRGEELVVLRRRDFDVFQKWKEKIRDVDSKVRRGRQEYKGGKAILSSSPKNFR